MPYVARNVTAQQTPEQITVQGGECAPHADPFMQFVDPLRFKNLVAHAGVKAGPSRMVTLMRMSNLPGRSDSATPGDDDEDVPAQG